MTIITLAQRERFLDHFPVSNNELDRLLSLYPRFAESSLSAVDDSAQAEKKGDFGGGCCSPPSSSGAEASASGIAEWCSNSCDSLEETKFKCTPPVEEEQQAEQRSLLLTSCERYFLPELVTILREAVASVFLVGFSNEPESIQQQATFLEAAVSLLGRRGDRFVRSVLFSTAAIASMDACSGPSPPVRATTLMNLLFRVVLARSFLENNTPKNQAPQQLLNVVEAATPMSWLRSITTGNHDNMLTMTSTESSTGDANGAVENAITFATWNKWTTETAPNIHQTLSIVFHYFLLGASSSSSNDEEEGISIGSSYSFSLEQQEQEEAGVFTMRPEPMPLPIYDFTPRVFSAESDKHHLVSFAAPLAAMTLGGNWRRIYASSINGLSFRTLQQALLGYAGPTVLLIRSTKGHVFGYFTEVPWKKSPHWYTGDGDAFFFTLHPVWKRYERTYDEQCSTTTAKSPQLQYLNLPPANHLVGNNSCDLAGLAVGGVAPDAPRLHLTPSLEQCMACPMDRQFVSGPLLANASIEGSVNDDDYPIFFDADELEVYAVRLDNTALQADAFECAVAAGQLVLDTAEAHRVRSAQVDKKQFVDDLINNAPTCSNLFAHREQTRGRASFNAHDEEEKGYYIHGKEPSRRTISKHDKNGDDDISLTQENRESSGHEETSIL